MRRPAAPQPWPVVPLWLPALLGLAGALALPAANPPWAVPGAAWRVLIDRDRDRVWGARVGHVQVWPCGVEPRDCQVTVTTLQGRPVGAEVLWSAPGEPVKVLFDASDGEAGYYLYLHAGPPPAAPWRAEGGVILETRPWRPGPFNDWPRAFRTFSLSLPVQGRSVLTEIFQGVNPHGPASNFFGLFTGWFHATNAGAYEFATVSDGASFLRVDDQVVAVKPPGAGGFGRSGRFAGTIRLAAGRHRLEYLCEHGPGELAAVAAWKPPKAPYLRVIPTSAFVPAARFKTLACEPAPNRPGAAYFEWQPLAHSVAGEALLVSLGLRAFPADPAHTCRWKFDDGAEATGLTNIHVFARRGLRRVELEVLAAGQVVARRAEFVAVQPHWPQMEEWTEATYQGQSRQLLARDWTRAPLEDLGAVVDAAYQADDRPLLSRVGAAALRRQAEFKQAPAPALTGGVFYKLGWHFQHPDVREYQLAEQALRANVEVATPGSLPLARAKRRLAQFLIEVANQPDEALALIASSAAPDLTPTEKRIGLMLQGDALLALGRVDEARKAYLAAGNLVDESSPSQEIRDVSFLETAMDYVRRGEVEAAEELLRRIERATPLARLSPIVGIELVKIHLARKEYPRALTRCLRLLHVAAAEAQRAQLLYLLAETHLALGRDQAARQALAKLIHDHPYSEAAARAKDKWPDKVPRAGK